MDFKGESIIVTGTIGFLPPVDSAGSLPATAADGDLIVTEDTGDVYTYTTAGGWQVVGGSTPGGQIIINSATGNGIKVDLTTPTFPYHDLLGKIHAKGTGANNPTWAVYRTPIWQYQFSVNDEVWVEFHMPHDYVPGTEIYIHVHWSHKETTVTSGGVTWGFNSAYARGYDTEAFSDPTTPVTIYQAASTTQYQHMIAEIQLSSGGGLIGTSPLEIDGLLLVRTYLSANTMNGTPEPFLHFVDIHYQSTNIGTKYKNTPFYTA